MRTYAKVMRYGSLYDLLHNETLVMDDRYAYADVCGRMLTYADVC